MCLWSNQFITKPPKSHKFTAFGSLYHTLHVYMMTYLSAVSLCECARSRKDDPLCLSCRMTSSNSGCASVSTSAGWLHTLRRYCSACSNAPRRVASEQLTFVSRYWHRAHVRIASQQKATFSGNCYLEDVRRFLLRFAGCRFADVIQLFYAIFESFSRTGFREILIQSKLFSQTQH